MKYHGQSPPLAILVPINWNTEALKKEARHMRYTSKIFPWRKWGLDSFEGNDFCRNIVSVFKLNDLGSDREHCLQSECLCNCLWHKSEGSWIKRTSWKGRTKYT